MEDLEKYRLLLEEIYWVIGRADPTMADLRGAAKQVEKIIEERAPEITKQVKDRMGWC